jgi:tetratricopeptide (TPR) repeat protein
VTTFRRGFSGTLLVLSLAALYLPAAAQFNDHPQRVQVLVRIFLDAMPQRAPSGVTVQVLDGFGSLELEGHTDALGEAHFIILSGDHKLRIFGRGVREYNAPLQILSVETQKTENVIVRSNAEAGSTPSASSETVPAQRLNIPAKAQQEFERGSNALGHKDWAEATKRFAAAVAIFPDYDLAYNGLGDAAMASGDLAAARSAFEKAISLNKNFAEAFRNLARVDFAEHKFEEADQQLLHSLDIDPLNARALTYAANAELLTHKYSDAIAHASKAHTLPHAGLAGVHIIAARAYEATNRPDDAVKQYRLYLDEEPQGRDAGAARDAIVRLGNKSGKQ